MKITNAKVFMNGRFIEGGVEFDEKILSAGAHVTGQGDVDAEGAYLIPGLIDVHVHFRDPGQTENERGHLRRRYGGCREDG